MDIRLLFALLFCHWMADFTQLSRPYMLSAKRFGNPLMPILHHSLVHGILMAITVFLFTGSIESAGFVLLFQTLSHFAIDILKGRMNVWFPALTNPANVYHWWVFGIDQQLHISVIIAIAYLV